MPLIRGAHSFDGQFTQIPNDWLRDGRLSLKARGLLALLMSHTPGWSVSIKSLIAQNMEGRDSLKAAVGELECFGYLERGQNRTEGKFSESTWTTKSPQTGFPQTDKPQTDNPHPKNTKVKNTKKIESPAGATRLSKDWKPSEESLAKMVEHFPWVDVKLQTHKFMDYWQAATKNAMKRDWDAAYRNWIRQAAEWQKPEPSKARNKIRAED
jgi:hypothetical protein